jgi:hypothetical protein
VSTERLLTLLEVSDLLRSGALEASKADGQWRIQKGAVESRIAKRARK